MFGLVSTNRGEGKEISTHPGKQPFHHAPSRLNRRRGNASTRPELFPLPANCAACSRCIYCVEDLRRLRPVGCHVGTMLEQDVEVVAHQLKPSRRDTGNPGEGRPPLKILPRAAVAAPVRHRTAPPSRGAELVQVGQLLSTKGRLPLPRPILHFCTSPPRPGT